MLESIKGIARTISIAGAIGLGVAMGLAWWGAESDSRASDYMARKALEGQHSLLNKRAWVAEQKQKVDSLWAEAQLAFKEAKALQSSGVKIKEIIKVKTETKTIELPPDLKRLNISADVVSAKVEDISGEQRVKVAINVNLADPASDWHAKVALEVKTEGIKFLVPLPPKEDTRPPIAANDGKYHIGSAWACGPGVMASLQVWPSVDAGVGLGFACIHGAGLVKIRQEVE